MLMFKNVTSFAHFSVKNISIVENPINITRIKAFKCNNLGTFYSDRIKESVPPVHLQHFPLNLLI